jgi:DNA-binding MurR/RpiR family transcriptional regulator
MATDQVTTPPTFDELKKFLSTEHARMPKRLGQVAGFVLSNPDEIAFGTVASIADMAGVQPSTLVRFAQAVGFQGFSDFQELFRTHMRQRWPSYQERLDTLRRDGAGKAGAAGLLDAFAASAIQSLSTMRETIQDRELEKAIAILASARSIYLLGNRRAFPAASYMAYAFGKHGIPATLVDNLASMGPEQIGPATADDALIAISFTPYAPETADLAAVAHGNKVPIVAISDSVLSPLAGISEVLFEVTEADFGAFRSLAATICLAMALCVSVAERRQAVKSGKKARKR